MKGFLVNNYKSHGWVCVCVRVCARARACVRACVCVYIYIWFILLHALNLMLQNYKLPQKGRRRTHCYHKSIKVKQYCYMPWRRLGERRHSSYSFTTLAVGGGEWLASHSGERIPGTHWTGGWVGPRAGLDTQVREKFFCLCQVSNFNHLVVQSIARRCSDWATLVPSTIIVPIIFIKQLLTIMKSTFSKHMTFKCSMLMLTFNI
jgi:hypothetical protein